MYACEWEVHVKSGNVQPALHVSVCERACPFSFSLSSTMAQVMHTIS